MALLGCKVVIKRLLFSNHVNVIEPLLGHYNGFLQYNNKHQKLDRSKLHEFDRLNQNQYHQYNSDFDVEFVVSSDDLLILEPNYWNAIPMI